MVDIGQFAGHLKVEVYLMELELCKDFNFSNTVKQKFSRKAKLGESLINVDCWMCSFQSSILFISIRCIVTCRRIILTFLHWYLVLTTFSHSLASLHATARSIFEVSKDVETQLWTYISEGSYNLIKDSETTLQDEMIFPSSVVILDIKGPDGNFASKEHLKR